MIKVFEYVYYKTKKVKLPLLFCYAPGEDRTRDFCVSSVHNVEFIPLLYICTI